MPVLEVGSMGTPIQWRNAGQLLEYPPEERRLVLARIVVEAEGRVTHIARATGYHRTYVHKLLYRFRLWNVVNAARIKRLEREAADRRRARP